MAHQVKHLYEFGPFCLDPTERVLLRDGQPVSLTPKVFDTLLVLVENSRHLLEKDWLMRKLWPDSFVEEANLAQNIFTLRRVLGSTSEGTDYIETVPKRGYRFIAEVKEIATPYSAEAQAGEAAIGPAIRTSSRRLWPVALALAILLGVTGYFSWQVFRPHASPRAGKIMLVVLPFENLSGDPQWDYFSDGLTEEMITQLARMHPERLALIARTSAMKYKKTQKGTDQIGRELQVDYILEGSVRREGGHVRVSAQLIQVNDETHLWAQSYERDLSGILAIQADVAQAIANEIHLTLTHEQEARLARPRLPKPEAYEAYLKGRLYWNRRTPDALKQSVTFFEQAIQLDPTFPLAYVGLADAYSTLASYTLLPDRQAFTRAEAAALKALELDNTLAEAHTSLALVNLLHDWDWAASERAFRRALELDPNYAVARDWYALWLLLTGRPQEALQENKRALELDPLSLIINTHRSGILLNLGRTEEAIAQGRTTLEMDSHFAAAYINLGWAYQRKGIHDEAIATFQQALELARDNSGYKATLAHAYALAGKRREAERLFRELRQPAAQAYVSPYAIATVYAGLGETDQAFEWLEKAYAQHDNWMALLRVDPRLDPLRSDARFQDLLRRVGLQP